MESNGPEVSAEDYEKNKSLDKEDRIVDFLTSKLGDLYLDIDPVGNSITKSMFIWFIQRAIKGL